MKSEKIKSPKTNRYIYINGNTYNNLIKNDGYTKEYLQSLSKTNVNNINDVNLTNNMLHDDILKEILYTSDINTIVNYCSTKKYNSICNDKNFWKSIFIRNRVKILEEPQSYKGWIEMYKNTVNAYKEAYALLTIPQDLIRIYSFVINHNFDKYFNKYAYFLSKENSIFVYKHAKTALIENDDDNNISLSIKEFYNLLIDLLYFYPDIKINSPTPSPGLPLRKKYIGDLRYKTGFKTHVNKILYRYQIADTMTHNDIINTLNTL